MAEPKLYLIDCSSLFFRSYYAIRNLSNSKGMATNAVYGYLTTILKLKEERLKPGDMIAACYDRPEPSFRVDIDENYKANRDECPEDLATQIPYIKRVNDALAIQGFEKAGFEADDLIGTLAKKAEKKKIPVVIVSGDKDFGQLLNSKVGLLDLGKEVYYDEKTFVEKWGIQPEQMIDYLSIVGDTSDNVPGVKGIGPKGAEKLLAEWGSLDDIYKNIRLIKNERTRNLLLEWKDQAYTAKKLVTIKTDMPIDIEIEKLKVSDPKKELLGPLLSELEFKSLLKKLVGDDFVSVGGVEGNDKSEGASSSAGSDAAASAKAQSHNSMGDATAPRRVAGQLKVHKIKKAKELESHVDAAGVWIHLLDGMIGVASDDKYFDCEEGQQALIDEVKEMVEKGALISGYDVKSQLKNLGVEAVDQLNVGSDILLKAYVDDANGETALDRLFLKFDIKAEGLGAFEVIQGLMKLDVLFDQKLDAANTQKLYQKLERPLIPILYHMEKDGILVDSDQMAVFSKELTKTIRELEKKVFKLTDSEFNLGSPKQLSQILFEKLKLPVIRKTKTGFSTDSDVLEELKAHHPVAEVIIEWRELSKLQNTYVDALPKLIDPKDGRIHSQFNQAVAVTGRLSSTNPNLQNIPIRTELGRKIRCAFIAEKGWQLLSADYSQIELRVLAHIAGDPGLIKAFEADLDIHTSTAAEIFEVPLNKVDAEKRRLAKAINFGIAYGMSDFGLAERLGIPRKEASDFIKRYFARFSGVAQYMEAVVAVAGERGYVGTLFGRRRYIPDIKHANRNIRMGAERAAINMPIQGTAADIVKKAMIDVDQKIAGRKDVRMLLQVHDELVFEVKKSAVAEIKELVVSTMENVVKLKVPLRVSAGSASNWDEAH